MLVRFRSRSLVVSVHRHRPRVQLLLLCVIAGFVWGGFLPWVAAQPTVVARLDELASQGIDASAMFYSELSAMEGVLVRLEEFRRRQPDALWRTDR